MPSLPFTNGIVTFGMGIKCFWLCMIILIAHSIPLYPSDAEPFIEDTLGGLRLGDHISRATHLYPALRVVDEAEGAYEVEIGTACLLTITTSTEKPSYGQIKMLFLEVTNPAGLNGNLECATLRTAKGYLFSHSIERAMHIYQGLTLTEDSSKSVIGLWQHNGKFCENGATNVMRSMNLSWLSSTRQLKHYVLEASEESCLDYIAGRAGEVPPQ